MKELRKIQKTIDKYQLLLKLNIEDAKRNKKHYIEDLESIQEYLNWYIEDISNELETWCKFFVENFLDNRKNYFVRIQRRFYTIVINYYINKFVNILTEAGKLQKILKQILTRFYQFEYFLNS